MKIMISVNGGVVQDIVATEPISIYLIDHDNIREKGGDTEDAKQAFQPWGVVSEGDFPERIDMELEDYEDIVKDGISENALRKEDRETEEEQEKINVVPAKETNSLRDKMKDTIQGFLSAYQGEGIKDFAPDTIAHNLTDYVFDCLEITADQQDIEGAKVVIDPKVVVQVAGGIIELVESSKDVDVELRDYDIEECSDQELKEVDGCDVVNDKTGRYIIK